MLRSPLEFRVSAGFKILIRNVLGFLRDVPVDPR